MSFGTFFFYNFFFVSFGEIFLFSMFCFPIAMACIQSKFGRQTDCRPLQFELSIVFCVIGSKTSFAFLSFHLFFIYFLFLLISCCIDVEYDFVNIFLYLCADIVCISGLPFDGSKIFGGWFLAHLCHVCSILSSFLASSNFGIWGQKMPIGGCY